MSIDHEPAALTHEDCLDNHPDEPCRGDVSNHTTIPVRYRRNGSFVMFPRCEKHYIAYQERCEALIERERRYQAGLYCKHGTYIGDAYGPDYLCGACESE